MPSIIDHIDNPGRTTHWAENVADTLLSPVRSWGLGHHFEVVQTNGEFQLSPRSKQYSVVLKIIAIALFPLIALATVFALITKKIVHQSTPSQRQIYSYRIQPPLIHQTAPESRADELVPFTYPQARRDQHVDDYNGVTVADPYRWLEDSNSTETMKWVEAQAAFAKDYLSEIPQRKEIQERLTELWNYPKHSLPFKEGERYFWFQNDGLQNQSVLYTSESYDGVPRILLDPNTLSEDGTTSLSNCSVSRDGKMLAYSVSEGGSDWVTIKVLDIESGNQLEDSLAWAKFTSIDWTKDHKGFFYSRFDKPENGEALQASNKHHKIYYHAIGTSQDEDKLIYKNEEHPDWLFHGEVTDDGNYLMINVADGCKEENAVFIKDLRNDDSKVTELFRDFDASYSLAGNSDGQFWFATSHGANHKRVIKVDLDRPASSMWREIVPENENNLESATIIGGKLVLKYLKDAHTEVNVHEMDGTFVRTVALPGIGTASGFGGKPHDTETFYSFSGFTTAPTTFRYRIDTGESEIVRTSDVQFDPEQFTTRQVFFESKDGTRIPMFISHKKGIELDGENRVLLYGYGGFNVSITPSFSVSNLVWMERGGISCIVNLRGGGEYGKEWHEGGMKLKKQNVFDDFIFAGRWLIEQNYTKPSKLGIMGGSNGGLLVGACLNQAPELFGAAIPKVGVMDMLRFNQFTIGKAWEADYGSPQNQKEFPTLLSYSPYHNLDSKKEYPAVMITTSDHDDRVVPLHSYKYAAELQHCKATLDEKPAIIRIALKTGHGAGRSTTEWIQELSDQWAFLEKHLK
jgi:prolyl oligopeptidase